MNGTALPAGTPWWQNAVVYQLYPPSFADGDGDGVGDIAGMRSRLDYLQDLGVDAVWVNPWYASPQVDGGYDVADYRRIHAPFGALDEAESFVSEVHRRGLRILLDVVPNHVSTQHRWFRSAADSDAGSPERRRFHFRRGRGELGGSPPNDWRSAFGGPAWTRLPGPGAEWYLHLFSPGQPDLDWTDPSVRAEFEQVLRFWFDRGVDGFRVDMAHALGKDPALPDLGPAVTDDVLAPPRGPDHPFWHRDEVHDVYRAWRSLADSYDPPRIFVAEVWSDHPDRVGRYLRDDELHSAFAVDYLCAPWRPDWLRRAVEDTLSATANAESVPAWALSNHDLVRHPSRYGRPQPDRAVYSMADLPTAPYDADLGHRRARAAILLTLALPGMAVLYQGEELGLPEVEELPRAARQDPIWGQSNASAHTRDGCRVPLPWSGRRQPYGFSPAGVETAPWLPQPPLWGDLSVEAQNRDPGSMLALYRTALRVRRSRAWAPVTGSAGCRRPRVCSPSIAAVTSAAWSTWPHVRRPCPTTGRSCSPADR